MLKFNSWPPTPENTELSVVGQAFINELKRDEESQKEMEMFGGNIGGLLMANLGGNLPAVIEIADKLAEKDEFMQESDFEHTRNFMHAVLQGALNERNWENGL